MECFPWDRHFETGLPEVDRQHRALVALINRFGVLLSRRRGGVSAAEIDAVFDQLVDYAHEHFRDEERLMLEARIDGRDFLQHIRQHVTFLREVTAMRAEAPPSIPRASAPLLKFLISWLAFHILGEDQSMARQLQAIAQGRTPAEAHAAEEALNNPATQPLLHALNSLFQLVSERNHELTVLNRTLEEKVTERTRELSAANERLAELALTDPLTGLSNRRHAMSRLSEAWSLPLDPAAPLACILLDADNFKPINDAFGHEAGDAVLRQLAGCLRQAIRTDDCVCRLGGDEFVILCPRTPLEGVLLAAEQVRQAVSELRVRAGAGVWRGSISAGVAVRTERMSTVEDLIRAADEGVYLAKRSGRNRVAYAGERAGLAEDPTRCEANLPPANLGARVSVRSPVDADPAVRPSARPPADVSLRLSARPPADVSLRLSARPPADVMRTPSIRAPKATEPIRISLAPRPS